MSSKQQLQFRLIGRLAYRWIPIQDGSISESSDETVVPWTLSSLPKKQQVILSYMLTVGIQPGGSCTLDMIRRDCWKNEAEVLDSSRDKQARFVRGWLSEELSSQHVPLDDFLNEYHINNARHITDLGYFYHAVKAAQTAFDAQRYDNCLYILTTWRVPGIAYMNYDHVGALFTRQHTQPSCLDGIDLLWAEGERRDFELACDKVHKLISNSRQRVPGVLNAPSAVVEPGSSSEIVLDDTPEGAYNTSEFISRPEVTLPDEKETVFAAPSHRAFAAPRALRTGNWKKLFALTCLIVLLCVGGWIFRQWSRHPENTTGGILPNPAPEPWKDLLSLKPIQYPEEEILDEPVDPKEVEWYATDTPVSMPAGKWILYVRLKAVDEHQPRIVRADMLEPEGAANVNPQDAAGCSSDGMCRRWALDSREQQEEPVVHNIQFLVAFHMKSKGANHSFSKPLCQYWFKSMKEEKK